jgi:hypothetical protein
MAGLIQKQMDTNPADDQPGMQDNPADDQGGDTNPADDQPGVKDDPSDDTGEAKGSTADLDPATLESKMKLPGKLKAQLDAVVMAGLKIMFSEQTHQLMLKTLDGPGPIEQKLGLGVAGLIALLFQQSQHSIPPQLFVPAGILLMAHAVQWLDKAGQPVTPEQFGAATQIMVHAILQQAKVDPAELQAKAQAMRQGGAPAASAQQPPPDAGGAPPGLIQGQQGGMPPTQQGA